MNSLNALLAFDGGYTDVLKYLLDANIDKVLLLAGIIFLLLAVVGRVSGRIDPGPKGRIGASVIGAVFVLSGLGIHFSGALTRDTPAGTDGTAPPNLGQVSPPVQPLVPPKGTNATESAWIEEHGLTSAGYQAKFDALSRKSYRPLTISGYVSGGAERYCTLWAKVSGPEWVSKHGLSRDGYKADSKSFESQGFRLAYVNVFEFNSQPRYSAIWNKRPAPGYVAIADLSNSEYQQILQQKKTMGLRPVFATGYSMLGSDNYAVIFGEDAGIAWESRHGLTVSEYQDQFNQLASHGFRVKTVSGYLAHGVDQFLGIWEKVNGPIYRTSHGISESSYQSNYNDLHDQGYDLVFVEAFNSGSEVKFNWIWEKRGQY
jgi:hypothetical protein